MNNMTVDNSPVDNATVDDATVDNVPMTVVAQFGEVTVYQTAAFVSTDNNTNDFNGQQASLKMQQVGQTSYGKLNLGLHVDDDAEQVLTNRMRLLSAVNSQLNSESSRKLVKRLHWVNQVHGKQIHDIDATALRMQPVNADAMISQQPNVGLGIMTADCVPIVLYQTTTGQIAAVHAGWQGLACGVIKATAERFDADAPIMAWIGVCISQSNYEVGSHVCDQLLAGCVDNQLLTASNIDDFQQRYVLAANSNFDIEPNNLPSTIDKLSGIAGVDGKKVYLNLPKLAVDQMQALKITLHTELPINCSYVDTRYYSYRRQTHLQQPATGRMALVIVRSVSN